MSDHDRKSIDLIPPDKYREIQEMAVDKLAGFDNVDKEKFVLLVEILNLKEVVECRKPSSPLRLVT